MYCNSLKIMIDTQMSNYIDTKETYSSIFASTYPYNRKENIIWMRQDVWQNVWDVIYIGEY